MRLFPLIAFLASGVTTLWAADPAFDAWADALAADLVRARPTEATATQYFSGAEQDALDRRLTPITKEFRAARVAAAQQALAELAKFDRAKLDPPQRTSAALIEWQLKVEVSAEPFEDFHFVFNQFGGLHVSLVNFLSQTHPIRNRRDVENYLARLELVAGQMDEGARQAREGATRGFLMPDFIIQSVLGQFERFLAGEPAQNVLVVSLDERAARLADVTAEERAKFVATAADIVTKSVVPAFRRAEAMLREQRPLAKSDAGLWRLPGGDRAYANALHRFTTTELTTQQIHEIGLQEVARIEQEMDTLFRQLGYRDGGIKERYEKLDLDSQPPAAPDPRPALLARFTGMVRDSEKRASLLFDLRPKAPIEVRREPSFTEKTAAAHYTHPARDGSRPGIFWAPLPGPAFGVLGMRTLVYHEGVPGHHFQIALQQETESLPRWRRQGIFSGGSAFSEGWALYAEQLAAENGWYAGDSKGRIGQLNAELFRARRLVTDTGLHTLRWTRQQAIDYGISPAEVERYVMNPGQACAYKIGMLRILELRAKAQQALGAKFSIKEFHNLVLQTGNVPLGVLEQVVDDWIATARQPPAKGPTAR
ncbi:MAG TPA: DUF885 domain-containing protein [Chthoniobacteraceae bacterium]|jgi:uncharacterized protein (DUF885 family)|nr:DUF885 domain-containing protein [Chthoniobacteraceae bacterium]